MGRGRWIQLPCTPHAVDSMVARFVQSNATGLEQIWSSYFTSANDPQRNAQRLVGRCHCCCHRLSPLSWGRHPDRFSYMRDWYLSVKALHLKGTVFHDGAGCRVTPCHACQLLSLGLGDYFQTFLRNVGVVDFQDAKLHGRHVAWAATSEPALTGFLGPPTMGGSTPTWTICPDTLTSTGCC